MKKKKLAIFDIDGTISANPSAFGVLMCSLMQNEQQVVVMTGALTSFPPGQMDIRKKQLEAIGIVENHHYDTLEIIVGDTVLDVAKGKGQRCVELEAVMMFEDSPLYVSEINKISPKTTTLLVIP